MKNKNLIITVVLILVFTGAGFFGGMKYQQGKRSNLQRQFQGGQNGARVQGARNGFRPVNGEIIGSDDKSITVKLADGSTKIVLFSDKTEINKAAIATKDDLKTGEKVAVFGTDNTDGTVTAQTIQLNPLERNFPTPSGQ